MRTLILSFLILSTCASTQVLASDVDRFAAVYQQRKTVELESFLKRYEGTAVYPYVLVRALDNSVIQNALINPKVTTLFTQYNHSLASQKLRMNYLKYWAQKGNWNNYTRYYRGLNAELMTSDAEFECSVLNYLSFNKKPISIYFNTIINGIDKVSNNCLKTLTLASNHGFSPQIIQQKILEIASTAKSNDLTLVRSHVEHWSDTANKKQILNGLTVIARARNRTSDFSITANESNFLPYATVALTQAHRQNTDNLLVQYHVYGQKSAPLALDWVARTALLSHNWQGMVLTINAMEKKQSDKTIWRYWLAKALQHIGQVSNAGQILDQLSRSTDYYGWLARQETQQNLPENHLIQDSTTPKNIEIMLQNHALNSIRQLNDAGLWVEAAQEMNLLYPNKTPQQYWVAAKVAEKIGLRERQINYAEKSGVLDWSTRFPQPYQSTILREARAATINPALVTAVMRQESRFMPHAYSSVGASGLMQLMPSTAKSVAQHLNLKINTDTTGLFQPDINIKLGSNYLKELENSGLKNVEVIASYNAGIGRVKQWNRDTQHLSKPEWVELIPFEETRNYVKNVLSNQAYYQYLDNPENIDFMSLY